MKFDSSSCMLKPVYFAFVKTMLEFFLQTTHFVKSRAHSPRPTSKIIAMIALRHAILMKANPVVSLHAHRLFSGRACSCKKDPCSHTHTHTQQQQQPKVYIYGYDRIDCLINHDIRQSHPSALQELHISDLITMIFET